jgi:hypothetical protein
VQVPLPLVRFCPQYYAKGEATKTSTFSETINQEYIYGRGTRLGVDSENKSTYG